ncbi:hypothetical protein ACWD5R_12650 [Streptomyces sp. NPDC002514]|uniref:hypothetical protein n=1 Tax=Streptomyces sp. NPDC001270 TaxID=3364554 RepID=UPI0036AF12CB
MILNRLDTTPCDQEHVGRRPRRRRWWHRIGWRPVAAQVLSVVAVTACVVSLICCGSRG